MGIKPLLRFKHLKARRIVDSWAQLKNLVENEGFPSGRRLSANTRVWFEDEIDGWLETRPTSRKKVAA